MGVPPPLAPHSEPGHLLPGRRVSEPRPLLQASPQVSKPRLRQAPPLASEPRPLLQAPAGYWTRTWPTISSPSQLAPSWQLMTHAVSIKMDQTPLP